LDFSIFNKEQLETAEKEGIDPELFSEGNFGAVALPLPNRAGNRITITFYFSEGHTPKYSAGGTGMLTAHVNGFFEISKSFWSGPSIAFHLREHTAPLEARIEFLNG
jgi:hypothetical protein